MDIFNPTNFAGIPPTTAVPAGIYPVQIVKAEGKCGSKNDTQSVQLRLQLRHANDAFKAYGTLFDYWLPFRYAVGDPAKEALQMVKTRQFVEAVRTQGFNFDITQLEAHASDGAAEILNTHAKPQLEGLFVQVSVSIGKDGRNNCDAYSAFQAAAPVPGATAPAAPGPAAAAPAAPTPPAPPTA